jgi:hypothetical protein
MKEETKPEMTAEELVEKWPYKLEDFTDPLTGNLTHIIQPHPDELRADLRSVIRGKMVEYEEWAQNQNYFKRPVPSAEQIVDEFLSNNQ